MSQRPIEGEYGAFYANYVKASEGDFPAEALIASSERLVQLLQGVEEEKGTFKYAEGKWSINEVLLHMIDTERIFVSRALRISRNDMTPLPGFEQDDYVPNSAADSRSLASLIKEFKEVRAASISLFEHLSPEMGKRIGTASGHPLSARATGFIIAGHSNHHANVIEQRYL